ncbi:family 20 glycosylhydrolase [uncultured Arcticibacterium sp.]|uniref:family 20 glycosylhydrolase n=1 Tax=uncultured Arcticibacterium sp. TaxID=2173042 RepID=UPI0030F683BE
MKKIFAFTLSLFISFLAFGQESLPVRGLAIAAPNKGNLDRFVKFMNEELAPRSVNTLILRVDYNFQYKSHPELVNDNALRQKDVDKLVAAAQKGGISLIPQINLLGHQSWHSDLEKLLQVYPEFDETPGIKLPEKYVWPNEDGLYCKSYCPLHPDVHEVVFEIVDEIIEAFKADAFHAGMDEVFYLGHEDCPRCQGRDKAELFAGEVTKIRNHLAENEKRLWIWGDRLIDGKTTGIGLWEASYNNTHRAIDMIPKDVMICDWHYERVDPTAVMFAMKGFDVATSPWRKTDLAIKQKEMMTELRANATPEMKEHFTGMVQTVWSGVDGFLDRFYGNSEEDSDAKCFKALFEKE